MTVGDMIKKWMKENGYDGFATYGCGGCSIDDPVPCDEGPYPNCFPAKNRILKEGEHFGFCGPGDVYYEAIDLEDDE